MRQKGQGFKVILHYRISWKTAWVHELSRLASILDAPVSVSLVLEVKMCPTLAGVSDFQSKDINHFEISE